MKNDLVFLTRDGCVNTPEMSINLDTALLALGVGIDYPMVNLRHWPRLTRASGIRRRRS